MNKTFSTIGLLLLSVLLQAQTVNDLLWQIETNNKKLQAERQRLQAAKTGFQTGLTLYDPQVSYDYMKGSPATAGNQIDFIINQPFDFPTAYGQKKKVSDLKVSQADFEEAVIRREILLEAKVLCVQLIYLNRRKAELAQRLQAVQKFYDDYQKKFERQQASILDLNKARLRLLSIQTEQNRVETERQTALQQLAELNGGVALDFTTDTYPAAALPPAFEPLFDYIESIDPALKYYEKQKQIGEAQTSLSKSLSLPKLEAGYHYQGILGQRFNGAHIGFNIPLWEKKNTVKYQLQQTHFYDRQIQDHHHEHYFEVKKLYDRAANLSAQQEVFRQHLDALNATPLLDKALQAGQVSTLEYFLELSLYYESVDQFLLLEAQYHETLARLLKHEL